MKLLTAPEGARARWYDAFELSAYFEARVMLGRNEQKRPELVPFLAAVLMRRRRALEAVRAVERQRQEGRRALDRIGGVA